MDSTGQQTVGLYRSVIGSEDYLKFSKLLVLASFQLPDDLVPVHAIDADVSHSYHNYLI
jgi:hypothetical protein